MKSDSALLAHLQNGDEIAWSEFYNMYVQLLYNFIRSNGIYDPDHINDVVLETWAAAPRAIANFDGQNATLKTFLFSIARRKVSDFWRKHKNQYELPEEIPFVESTQENLELQEALAKLPDQERQALVLRYLEGFSVSEIADILDRTYKGTESLLSRARKRLETELLNLGK